MVAKSSANDDSNTETAKRSKQISKFFRSKGAEWASNMQRQAEDDMERARGLPGGLSRLSDGVDADEIIATLSGKTFGGLV